MGNLLEKLIRWTNAWNRSATASLIKAAGTQPR